MPVGVVVGSLVWVGATLLLSELRWFSRRGLVDRVGPYLPGGTGTTDRVGLLSVASFREALGPVVRVVGERLSRTFGVREDLGRRLERIHSGLDVTAFRLRQVGWGLAGFGAGGLLGALARVPAPVGVLLTFGAPLLAVLVVEQQVAAASERWQRAVRLELPVVAEQIGMLLGAGYSLGGALGRVAARGNGAVARDLARVVLRVRQGADEQQALDEWARLSAVDTVERLVRVLALEGQTSDLGRLIAVEAREMRGDVQRERLATMERRGQQVWIPVTVATLVPGVIFVAVPFFAALDAFLG